VAEKAAAAPAASDGSLTDTLSSIYLGGLGLIFAFLACTLLLNPVGELARHGLDISAAPASGLAEIRAFYFGTMAALAVIMWLGAGGDAPARARGLLTAAGVFGSFVGVRAFSYKVDGPPDNAHAHLMTAVEALGAAAALALWWPAHGRQSRWGQGVLALAASEPLTTPGEVLGNAFGAYVIYATWPEVDARTAEGALTVVGHNLLRYALSYGGAFFLFYRLRVAAGHKFTAEYEDAERLRTELRYWCCSVVVGTAYDLGIRAAAAGGHLPPLRSGPLTGADWALFPLVVGFADLHFYAMHRTLHRRWLYKHVHSVHHQSRNPNPFSGLNFHPAESSAYFSASLCVAALAGAAGLHRAHYALVKGLLDFNPVWGHAGFGGWFGGSHHHYVHHTVGYRLHINFGGTWLFDGLLGTGHVACLREVMARRGSQM
jgi:sterol desaturase/sphingolipid hydroxylase (fatty acid hydroxylase superfamily)